MRKFLAWLVCSFVLMIISVTQLPLRAGWATPNLTATLASTAPTLIAPNQTTESVVFLPAVIGGVMASATPLTPVATLSTPTPTPTVLFVTSTPTTPVTTPTTPEATPTTPVVTPTTPVATPENQREWTLHKTADGVHPSGLEQQLVWLMNRARANPAQEGEWLATTDIPAIAGPRDFFNVNLDVLRAEFAAIAPKPPAAFDVRLYNAAYAHSLDLIARDSQDHDGQFEKVSAAGFVFQAARGNVYSYAEDGLNTHAGFNIDWGGGPDGMQDPRGHRLALMAVDGNYTNVGPALVEDQDNSTEVGPLVTTVNYAEARTTAPDHYNRFLVGTIWSDLNGNTLYDPGEGLGGVLVQLDHGDFFAISGAAGGYALPILAPGDFQVHFALAAPMVQNVTVGETSVLLDMLVAPTVDRVRTTPIPMPVPARYRAPGDPIFSAGVVDP